MIQPSALIHDGVFIYKSDRVKIDTDAISERVKTVLGVDMTFSVKEMQITTTDRDWKARVIDISDEHQEDLARIAALRGPFASLMATRLWNAMTIL